MRMLIIMIILWTTLTGNEAFSLKHSGDYKVTSASYEEDLKHGVTLFYSGEWEEAKSLFDDLAEFDKKDIRPAFFKSMLPFWRYFFAGQEQEAAEQFLYISDDALKRGDSYLSSHPGDTTSVLMMGGLYGYRALVAAAEKKYRIAIQSGAGGFSYTRKLLRLSEDYPDAQIGQGVFHYMMGSVPKEARWLTSLAGFKGNRERGLQLLEESASADTPTSTDARMILVYIYFEEEAYSDALRMTESLIKDWPDNPVFNYYHARSLDKNGFASEAGTFYKNIAENDKPVFSYIQNKSQKWLDMRHD